MSNNLVTCPACAHGRASGYIGKWFDIFKGWQRCTPCHGSGQVRVEGIPGAVAAVNKAAPGCATCLGTGWVGNEDDPIPPDVCSHCSPAAQPQTGDTEVDRFTEGAFDITKGGTLPTDALQQALYGEASNLPQELGTSLVRTLTYAKRCANGCYTQLWQQKETVAHGDFRFCSTCHKKTVLAVTPEAVTALQEAVFNERYSVTGLTHILTKDAPLAPAVPCTCPPGLTGTNRACTRHGLAQIMKEADVAVQQYCGMESLPKAPQYKTTTRAEADALLDTAVKVDKTPRPPIKSGWRGNLSGYVEKTDSHIQVSEVTLKLSYKDAYMLANLLTDGEIAKQHLGAENTKLLSELGAALGRLIDHPAANNGGREIVK